MGFCVGLTAALLLLAALGLAALGLSWLRQRETAKREAFQELAARRGWSLTITKQTLGRPAILRMTTRSGTHWQAEARRLATAGTGSNSIIQTTEFRSEEPKWPDGLLLVGPALPAGTDEMALQMLDALDGDHGRTILSRVIGSDLSQDLGGLKRLQNDAGLTVLASGDPGQRVDLPELTRLLSNWTPVVAGEKGCPIVILGEDGLRVRLRHGTSTADRMERFIDFSHSIAKTIERR